MTSVAISGGGPAGMVLGLLLARAGVQVTVLEKHPDFLRDFRGDTVHPPTMRLLDDLGLGPAFRKLPAGRMTTMQMRIGDRDLTMGDLRRIPGPYQYFAMVPQWDLLNLLTEAASQEPPFTLHMTSEVTGLTHAPDGRVNGVEYRDATGSHHLPADLVVACDGRRSAVRQAAGLELEETDLPMDVWWVRVPMAPGDDRDHVVSRFTNGHVVVSMARHGYHQVAYLLAKGTNEQRRQGDVDTFRQVLAEQFGWTSEQLASIASWEDVKFLDARAGMLRRWWAPGVLAIGDAAHPMSPVMGVGINLAIQDAVATARLLAPHLLAGDLQDHHLAAVERRRRLPSRITRAMQDAEHEQLIRPALEHRIDTAPLPLFVRAMQLSPRLSAVLTWLQVCAMGRETTPAFARRPAPIA